VTAPAIKLCKARAKGQASSVNCAASTVTPG
jgi:hypothetical protein